MSEDTTPEPQEGAVPFQIAHATLEKAAVKATMSVNRVALSFPNEESRDHFQRLLNDLMEAHLNALGAEVGMIARAAMAGQTDIGVGAAIMQTQMMQQSAHAAFQTLVEQIDGPKVEIAGAGSLLE